MQSFISPVTASGDTITHLPEGLCERPEEPVRPQQEGQGRKLKGDAEYAVYINE